jgi:acetyl esterase
MPVYDRTNIPDTVGRGTLDAELKAWLPTGPTLGADVPIAQGRRDHMQLGIGPWPSMGGGGHPGPARTPWLDRRAPSPPSGDGPLRADVSTATTCSARRVPSW